MSEEGWPAEEYQEFVEPRQLTLNSQDSQTQHREERPLVRQIPEGEPPSFHDPLSRPYADLENTGYPLSAALPDALDLSPRADGRGAFLWSGDYGPTMMDGYPEFPPIPLDDWSSRMNERQELGYASPSLPSYGFPPFPGIADILGHSSNLHAPGPTLPPLHSFAPLSPFPFDSDPVNMLQPPHALHADHQELGGETQLPLLPSLGSYLHDYEDHHILQDARPPQAESSSKKTRVDKRNTKPLTVEDLIHDNSRFAKVVKAFLSIEDQENRTVPEIAKRVSEMYAGQYADFEGVKRMVNDVLQKHKAFWHPGRGSPYQLNLNEGRARREFPSNSRRLVRNRYDENLFYSRSKKQKRSKHPVKTEQDILSSENIDPALLRSDLQGKGEDTLSRTPRRGQPELEPAFNERDVHEGGNVYAAMTTLTSPHSPGRLRNPVLSPREQTNI